MLVLLRGCHVHDSQSEVDTDSIGNVLCKKAQDLHAVAIVMASHSKSSLQQFFLGRSVRRPALAHVNVQAAVASSPPRALLRCGKLKVFVVAAA